MPQTLEQRRAVDAWKQCQGQGKDYTNLAKGLPALIMNSGLMQVVAFLHEKGGVNETLGKQLRAWLHGRFPAPVIRGAEFTPFMESLLSLEKASDYQAITTEAFAWLRWVRQIAPARLSGE